MKNKKKSKLKTFLIILIVASIFLLMFFLIRRILPEREVDVSDIELILENPLDDESYISEAENIVYTNEYETAGYINNILYIVFNKESDEDSRSDLISSINGDVVDTNLNMYQVKINPKDKESLKNLADEIKHNKIVNDVMLDYITTVENQEYPNDPWAEGLQGLFQKVDWDEENPSGNNWWYEAVKLSSAQDSIEDLKQVNVGIVDNGIDLNHEDLDINIINEDFSNTEVHGTFVSGIIGAINNNNKGITGINPEANIFFVDIYKTGLQKIFKTENLNSLEAIQKCLENNCKVINYSSGLDKKKYPSLEDMHEAAINDARNAAGCLLFFLNNFDNNFIIVQSAGNNDINSGEYNGLFCSITDDLLEEALEEYDDEFKKNHPIEEIKSHYIIVGSIDNKSNESYPVSSFSNFGNSVTLYAPGNKLFSTRPFSILDGSYQLDSGTSFSAPIVAGTASLLWSINENFTPSQVKDILVSTATNKLSNIKDSSESDSKLLDVYAAVLKAKEEVNKTESAIPANKENANSNIKVTDDNWKEIYIKYINDTKSNFNMDSDYVLVDINDDEIPELYIDHNSTAGGAELLTYNPETRDLNYQVFWTGGFSYIPRKNLILSSGGHMDVYFNEILTIENNNFVSLHKGEYGLLYDNANIPDNYEWIESLDGIVTRNPAYTYIWDNEEVDSADRYLSKFNNYYDYKSAIYPLYEFGYSDSDKWINTGEGSVKYSEIIKMINDY